MANEIKIAVTATGAEQASKVLADLAKSGAQVGSVTAAGAGKAQEALDKLSLSGSSAFKGLLGQLGEVKAQFAQGQGGISLYGLAMQALTNPITAVVVGLGAITAIGIKAAESLQEDVKAVKSLQNVSGLGAAEASSLSNALKLMGKDSDVISRAFFKMGAEIESGGSGLARLGVSIRDSSGQLKNEGQLFLEVRDKMSKLGDASTRNALLMDIFGRQGRELISVMGLSREKFDALVASGERLNPMTQQMIDKTMVLTRAQREHDLAWQGLMNTIGIAVVGPMAAVVHWATRMIELSRDPIVFTIKLVTGQPLQGNEGFFADISKKVHDALAAGGLTGGHLDVDLSKNDETFGLSNAATPTVPGKAQVAAEIALIGQREKAALSSLSLVDARIKDSLARNLITETQAVEQEIALAIRRRDVEISAANQVEAKVRAGVMGGKPEAGTEQFKAIQEQESKKQDAVAKTEAIIQGFRTKTFQLDQQLAQFEIQDMAKMAIAAQASADARLAINSKLALDLVAIHGSDEAQFMARLTAETGALLEQATNQIKDNRQLTDTLGKIWEVYYAKLRNFQENQRASDTIPKLIAELAHTLEEATPDVVAETEAWKNLNLEWRDAQKMAQALGGAFDLTNAALSNQQKVIAQLIKDGWDPLGEKVKAAVAELDKFKALSFSEELDKIDAQAKVLGPDFDSVGKKISATQAELSRLATESHGEITPAIAELQGKLAGLMGDDFVNKMRSGLGLTRTVFDELLDAGRATASALHTGFSDGFFALFTGEVKSLGDVFANFGKSMLRVLTDFLASAAVRGLLSFFGDLISGFSGGAGVGGGWVGAILAGAGAILARFSSSSSSGIGPGTGTDPTGALNSVGLSATGASKGLDLLDLKVTNFSAGVGAALSAIGVGVGIYSLAQGGSAGSMALSAGGTALSLYSLAVSASQLAVNAGLIGTALPTIGVLIAQGFAAVAPTWAAAVGSSLSGVLSPAIVAALTGVAPGAAGAAGATSAALSGALAGLGASLAIFSAFLSMGLAGQAQAAEMQVQDETLQAKEITNALGAFGAVATLLNHWGTALSAVNLPGTLQKVSDALQSLPDLLKAVGLNAFGISDMVPELRAKIGFALLTALDAAAKQGVDASFVTAARVHMPDQPDTGGNYYGNMGGESYQYTARDLLAALQRWADTGGAHDDGFGSRGEKALAAMAAILQDVIAKANVHDAEFNSNPDIYHQNPPLIDPQISPAELNAMLDKEYLTIAIRNAVVDIGTMFGLSLAQFDAAGLGHDTMSAQNAQGGVDVGTSWSLQSGLNLPSVQAIADVQARLDAAGFTPGNYGKALEAFLISVDANVVNNPAWKKFTDALEAGDAAGSPTTITDAINAAIVATMTPEKFYDSAKVITDVFAEAIKALATKQADLVTSGAPQDAIDAISKQIEAMQVAIKAYAGLVQLYTSLPVEMAAITGDLVEQTKAFIDAWKVSVKALGDSVQAAQQAFQDALESGNVIAIQQAAQQLHDVTIAGYQMMLKAVEQINAAIKGILDQAATLVQTVAQIAMLDIGSGAGFGTTTALLGALQGMAEHGETAAMRLWAVDTALKSIIAILPSAIAKYGGMQTADDWLGSGMQTAAQLQASGPNAISRGVVEGAAPFLAAQQTAINNATGGAKLGLLQQQAADWTALANAAIAGVTQWANQAIAGATAAAKVVTDGIDKQIAGIQKAEQLAAESRRAEMEGLQARIAKQREFEAAMKSMGQFIEQLKLGSMAPINPMDQLIEAQGTFATALAAYNAAPTATGLGDLQTMAQAVLQAGAGVYTRPSPEYQALFGGIVSQLEAANALAKTMAPDDSTVLQSQLDALQALDKTASKAATDQIAALNDQKAAVAAALVTQIAAIEQAAKDEIAGISAGLATALKDNAAQQAPLLQAQFDAAVAALAAIGDTEIWQEATRIILQNIADNLALAITGAKPVVVPGAIPGGTKEAWAADPLTRGGTPQQAAAWWNAQSAGADISALDVLRWYASTPKAARDAALLAAFAGALPKAAGGMDLVPRTMPVLVHQGERILTKAERLAYERGGVPTVSAPQGQRSGGPSITYAPTINVTGGGDPTMVKAMVKEALRESQRDFLRKIESGSEGSRLRSNTRSRA